jgi:Tol biopolymer transport system component
MQGLRSPIIAAFVAATAVAVIALASSTPAAANPRGFNGKIVTNSTNLVTGEEQVYTVDPDGTDQQLVANNSETGQWSPGGTLISLFDRLLNPDDGSLIDLNLAAQYPDLFLPCPVWSSDGARIACEGLSFEVDPNLNGVYTVRSSDGGDLQQITSNPGGDDCPSDYSPNGKRIIFTRASDTVYALFTVKLDGSGLRQITPSGMDFNFCNGSWSPQGNEILFSAHVPNGDYRSTTWVVHSDGTGLRQIPIPGCGGLFSDPTSVSCFNSSWSPDGQKIVFARIPGATGRRDLYTVNADGSGLFQVTHTPDIDEDGGDWGTHPLTP